MKQIVADGNKVIELYDNTWRLLSQNGMGNATILVEVQHDLPVHFSDQFIIQHRLPEASILNESIRQIVLGWSQQDTSWHLGLLLSQTLSESRGNPWCGLARWQSVDANGATTLQPDIKQAAEQLGQLTGIPVHVVPTKTQITAPVAEAEAATVMIPLPQSSGEWTLQAEAENSFALIRNTSWMNGRYRRIAWYAFWMVAFLLVSIATLTIPLGLPNSGMILPYPELLPYMGIIVSIIVLGLIIKNLREITSTANHIVFDSGSIIGSLNQKICWTLPADEIQAVYVSQIVRFRRKTNLIEYGEINLLRHDGSFIRVLFQEDEQETEKTFNAIEGKKAIKLDGWNTSLQAMALQLAHEMGVECYYDERS